MSKQILTSSFFCLLIMSAGASAAKAQASSFDMSSFGAAPSQFNSSAAQGQMAYTTNLTGQGPQGMGGLSSALTGKQSTVMLPTGLGQLTPGGLPPTRLDSLVANSGGMAFQIYGDEGVDGPPPLTNFATIGSGLNSPGLTTGHIDPSLPSAWNGGGVGNGGGGFGSGSDGGSSDGGSSDGGSSDGGSSDGGSSDGGSSGGGMSDGGSSDGGSSNGGYTSDGGGSNGGSMDGGSGQDTSAYGNINSYETDSSGEPVGDAGGSADLDLDPGDR